MKIEVDLSGLEAVRRKMGASEKRWIPEKQLAEVMETRQALLTGIVSELGDISVETSGLLAYKGQQIAIYIKDHTRLHSKESAVLTDAGIRRKLHVFDCEVLERMRREKRFDRYVMTIETEEFKIDLLDISDHPVPLNVCKVCLKALAYKGYTGGETDQWKDFSLKEFFGEYSTFFAVPTLYKDYASPSYRYTKDWSKVSARQRERVSWICQKSSCRANLSLAQHRHLLHTHHKNGVKGDNSSKNLEVLCKICHSKEPSHQHMKHSITAEEKATIIACRPSQR